MIFHRFIGQKERNHQDKSAWNPRLGQATGRLSLSFHDSWCYTFFSWKNLHVAWPLIVTITWGQREGNESYQSESGKGKPTRLLNEAAERTQLFAAKKVRLVEWRHTWRQRYFGRCPVPNRMLWRCVAKVAARNWMLRSCGAKVAVPNRMLWRCVAKVAVPNRMLWSVVKK